MYLATHIRLYTYVLILVLITADRKLDACWEPIIHTKPKPTGLPKMQTFAFSSGNAILVWIFETAKLNCAICLIQLHTLAGTLVMGVHIQQKTTFPLWAEAVLRLADSVPRRTHLRQTTCAYTSFCSTPVNVHNPIGKTTDSCNTINHICAHYSWKFRYKNLLSHMH